MEKSVVSRNYRVFLDLLREARIASGVTQVDLAERLEMTQSSVSKCERGERRLDVMELMMWCHAIGISSIDFMRSLEQAVSDPPLKPTSKRKRAPQG